MCLWEWEILFPVPTREWAPVKDLAINRIGDELVPMSCRILFSQGFIDGLGLAEAMDQGSVLLETF
jgi:hypothetical protein